MDDVLKVLVIFVVFGLMIGGGVFVVGKIIVMFFVEFLVGKLVIIYGVRLNICGLLFFVWIDFEVLLLSLFFGVFFDGGVGICLSV